MKTFWLISISLLFLLPQSLQAQSKRSWGGSVGGYTTSYVYSARNPSTPNTVDSVVFFWNKGGGLSVTGFAQYQLSEKSSFRVSLSLFQVGSIVENNLPSLSGIRTARMDHYKLGLPLGGVFHLGSNLYANIGLQPNLLMAYSTTEKIRSSDEVTTRSTEVFLEKGIYRRVNIDGHFGLSYELMQTESYGIRLFSMAAIDLLSYVNRNVFDLVTRPIRIGGGIELISIR